jgi:hypothetical protein
MLKNKSWILLVIFALFGFINTSIPVWTQENTTTQFDNAILANNQQPVVPTGRADTSVNSACQSLIDEIVRCNSGNGSCVVLKFRKADNPENPNYNKLTENAKKCVGSNSSILSENQKLDLINKVCLVLPPATSSSDRTPRDITPSDRTFFCQACIGRGVNPGWTADQVRDKCNQAISYTPNNNNTPRKLVKLVPDNNGQLKEVLATRINVKEKPLGVARATEDNFYLTVANQLVNPFSNQSNFVFANTQSQQKTLIIEASEISNVVPGQGIVKSQGETCTFDFSPGEGWQVVTPPANGITNQGVCSTEVTIKPNFNQTAFWGFGQVPVWAQGGGNQFGTRVKVCAGSTCASVDLNVVGQVIADASTNVLNFFENQCFFPNQTLSSDGTVVCTPDQALSVRIFRFILNVAPAVAFTVALFASFLLLIGKEKEGRSWLQKAIIGLIAIFAITTIVGLIEQSIEKENVSPITDFVRLAVNNFIIPLASIVSLIYFIIGSYKVMFSGTDEGQVKEGWKYMQNAIIGFVIVLLSFSLAQVIINLFLFVSSTL